MLAGDEEGFMVECAVPTAGVSMKPTLGQFETNAQICRH